jgi:hypothetical protein
MKMGTSVPVIQVAAATANSSCVKTGYELQASSRVICIKAHEFRTGHILNNRYVSTIERPGYAMHDTNFVS